VTGNLRDVMKESISAAASYVRSRASASVSSRRCLIGAISTSTCLKGDPKEDPRRACDGDRDRFVMDGIPVRHDVAIDRRDHVKGTGAADRRLEGEAPGCRPWRIKTVLIPEDNAKGPHGEFPMRSRVAWTSSRSHALTT